MVSAGDWCTCAQGKNETGVLKLTTVDAGDQKHGYFVNMILGCLLRGMSPDTIKKLGGQGDNVTRLSGKRYSGY